MKFVIEFIIIIGCIVAACAATVWLIKSDSNNKPPKK